MTSQIDVPEKVWIGPYYPECRVLVLGESWYGDFPEDRVTDDGYIRAYLAGDQPDQMYSRMANACGLTKEEFWNRIAFTNFVVARLGDSRSDRPTDVQYRNAVPRLKRLLSELAPHGVWVLGKEQGRFSAPEVLATGLACAVTAHPTSYGLSNEKLGESWC